jgi:hypothetical protein
VLPVVLPFACAAGNFWPNPCSRATNGLEIRKLSQSDWLEFRSLAMYAKRSWRPFSSNSQPTG